MRSSQNRAQRVYARGQIEVPAVNGKPTIIEVPSSSGNKVYKVDLSSGRCSCLGWTMNFKNGKRHVCRHLKTYGFTDI